MILASFGVGSQTDALFAALTIPALLNGIVFVQSPKILIPVFSAFFDRNDDGEAWGAASEHLDHVRSFAGRRDAGWSDAFRGILNRLKFPGSIPVTIAIAVWLSRVLFVLVLLQGLASILQSALTPGHSYLVAGASKFVINAITIIVVLVGQIRSGFGIQMVAWGMVFGSVVQLGLLVSALAGHGFRNRWTLNPRRPEDTCDSRVVQLSADGPCAWRNRPVHPVNNILGSLLGSGSLTLVRYASRIVQAIAGILLGSVVQVTMPIMARHAAANDLGLQRRKLGEHSTAGRRCTANRRLVDLHGRTSCRAVFPEGQFSATDAVLTAGIIRLMVPDLLIGRFGECDADPVLRESRLANTFYQHGNLRGRQRRLC